MYPPGFGGGFWNGGGALIYGTEEGMYDISGTLFDSSYTPGVAGAPPGPLYPAPTVGGGGALAPGTV